MGLKTSYHLGNAFFVLEFFVEFQQGGKTVWDGIVSDSNLEDNALDEVKNVLFGDRYVFLSQQDVGELTD